MAHAYRDDFPLLKSQDVAYLDNAATAQRPQCVLDAVTEFYKSQNANPLRGLYPLSIAATEAYENAREAVRSFLNAKSSREIIFTRNTTESINLVAYSYGLSHVKAGDEVLVSIMEHHSNLLPWQMVCRQTGASLKFMECEMDGTLDLNKVEALIEDRRLHARFERLRPRESHPRARGAGAPRRRGAGRRRRAEHAAHSGGRASIGRGFLRLLRPQGLRPHGHRRSLRT